MQRRCDTPATEPDGRRDGDRVVGIDQLLDERLNKRFREWEIEPDGALSLEPQPASKATFIKMMITVIEFDNISRWFMATAV